MNEAVFNALKTGLKDLAGVYLANPDEELKLILENQVRNLESMANKFTIQLTSNDSAIQSQLETILSGVTQMLEKEPTMKNLAMLFNLIKVIRK